MVNDETHARMISAILARLGETGLTISRFDLQNAAPIRVHTEPNGDTVFRIERRPDPNQGELLPADLRPHQQELVGRLENLAAKGGPAKEAIVVQGFGCRCGRDLRYCVC